MRKAAEVLILLCAILAVFSGVIARQSTGDKWWGQCEDGWFAFHDNASGCKATHYPACQQCKMTFGGGSRTLECYERDGVSECRCTNELPYGL